METYYVFVMDSYYLRGGFDELVFVTTDRQEALDYFDSLAVSDDQWAELWSAAPGEHPVRLTSTD